MVVDRTYDILSTQFYLCEAAVATFCMSKVYWGTTTPFCCASQMPEAKTSGLNTRLAGSI